MKLDLNEEDDFGFTMITADDLAAPEAQVKLEMLRDMIMPLLNNLKKDGHKDVIHWPNRVEKIDAFIQKINKLVDG
jgi:hypothetical protein